MNIDVSASPEFHAAGHITNELRAAAEGPVLLLLAAGSALAVPAHIDEFSLGPNVTVMMGDERFSIHEKVNNFIQLQASPFYKIAQRRDVSFIETVPDIKHESPQSFAMGIEKTLAYYYKVNPDARTIALFSIGQDGHFAGIFPTRERDAFYRRYHTIHYYQTVFEAENEHPQRLTITPYFIKQRVDTVLLYAIGKEKCDLVLQELLADSRKEHELPVLIPARHPKSTLYTDCSFN